MNRIRNLGKNALAAFSSVLIVFVANGECSERPKSEHVFTIRNVVYGQNEMLSFRTEKFLEKFAPHLREKSEAISHVAGRTGISPKLLLAMMEQRSRIISIPNDTRSMQRPFGNLSKKIGFREQLEDVATNMAAAIYSQIQKIDSSKRPSISLLVVTTDGLNGAFTDYERMELAQIYFGFFGSLQSNESRSSRITLSSVPNGSMRLPYENGKAWNFSGAHMDGLSLLFSSIDFAPRGSVWGGDTSANRVTASAGGIFIRHSSCSAEILHDGGWSTTYYHMDNLRFQTNSIVRQGDIIGTAANSLAQALCEGGSSSGPHVHWSIKRDGIYQDVDQSFVSGYLINSKSSINYDTNCTLFYLKKNGIKYCAGRLLTNSP